MTDSNETEREHRRGARFCLVSPLDRVRYEAKAHSGEARIANLSITGALLDELTVPLEIGDQVTLELGIVRATGPVTLGAHVVRHADPAGVAIALDCEIDDETQQLLAILMSALSVY